MLLHLSLAQRAWSAGSCLVLQGARRPIPLLVPVLNGSSASSHSMAGSERCEGMSRGAWSVLKQDAVLVLRSELLHGCMKARQARAVGARGVDSVHGRKEKS